ncbi:MAG TPA: tetratricopeptide repeat protein [Thermoanaerobaculia bacterium]|nr:tetratricopeptide repeat protein [Thermoanaerobaculia bacterium]
MACAPRTPPPLSTTEYAGRQTCAGCHADQDRLWQGSHHDLAMQEATPATVLGDFGGATLTHFGVTSTFFRRNERFFVRTDGPDGKLHDYPVSYTFGVSPLQQYLVEMPGGRLQVLPLCWDTRGKRWFHLYPGEAVPAGDALHWTGPNQTWNYMCADCHSTGLRKGYDADRNIYQTSWSEIDVSCEACHGPGSRHVIWARGDRKAEDKGFDVHLKDPGRGTWIADPRIGFGRRLAPAVRTDEIETCARCHARSSNIRPALLDAGLYHADGQIDGEVYEVGSFLQSRMHAKGVTCADCHEPHSLTPRRSGNALCTHCHAAEKLDTPAHHHHKAAMQCVDCHMPEKTYMSVDARRDHSLRVPRPDLSVKIGTPNACTGCHTGKSDQWAASAAERWYGAPKPHWSEAIQAGHLTAVADDPEIPAIVRGTALSRLRQAPAPDAVPSIERGLRDPDPLVRFGAITATEALDPKSRLRLASPLLTDPDRSVRIEAARILIGSSAPGLEPALAEFQAAQEQDRPEGRLNLGWLAATRGDLAGAEAAYRAALKLDPLYLPAFVNLADLYREQGREPEGEALLRQALRAAPDDASLHHARGLLLVRTGRLDEALPELARAVELAPGEARYAYVYEVAIQSHQNR